VHWESGVNGSTTGAGGPKPEGRRLVALSPEGAPEITVENSIDVAAFMGAADASQSDETSPLRLGPSGAVAALRSILRVPLVRELFVPQLRDHLHCAPVRSARFPVRPSLPPTDTFLRTWLRLRVAPRAQKRFRKRRSPDSSGRFCFRFRSLQRPSRPLLLD
jgi:hypothetical protein